MQTKTMSAIESGAQMLIGYVVAVGFYMLIFPLFGYELQIAHGAGIALLMFPVNWGRQYLVRRAFNWWHR